MEERGIIVMFERAAATAADPKENWKSCRRVVSGDASETVLQVALGNQKVGPKLSFLWFP